MSPMDRRAFLSATAIAGVAATLPPELTHAMLPPPPDVTFPRNRTRLVDMPAADMQRLFNDMVAVLRSPPNAGYLSEHKITNGAHGVNLDHPLAQAFGVPPGKGRAFFTWHRDYLHRFEGQRMLKRALPSWAPWETIPQPFLDFGDASQRVVQPAISRAAFIPYSLEMLQYRPDLDALGVELSYGAHLWTHIQCHGLMSKVETAQLHPLFYPWHSFVDEIFATWEGITKFRTPYQPPNSWPWGKMPRLVNPPGTPANAQRAHVPFLLGLNRDRAKQVLAEGGLHWAEHALPHADTYVLRQDPLPFTDVPRGSNVNIFGDLPSPF